MPDGNECTEWPAVPVVPRVVDVCRFFNISRTLWHAWRDSGAPIEPDGQHNLHRILLWRMKTRGVSTRNETELKVEKLQIANAAAALALREKQGELVSRREVKARISELFHRIRTRLEAVPAEISTLAPTAQRAEFLADSKLKIRLLLKEMESWSSPAAESPETEDSDVETAELDDADTDPEGDE